MDNRLRRLQRAHAESKDVHTHAAYIREGIRSGELDKDRIALCAFLGHEAARISIPECVRNDRILYFNRAIPNVEIREIAAGLPFWGPLTVLVGSVAVAEPLCDALEVHRFNRPDIRDALGVFEKCKEYVNNPTKELRIDLRKNGRVVIGYSNYANQVRMIQNIRSQIIYKKRYNITTLLIASSLLDDDIFMSSLRNRIYPWVLREFI